MFNPKYARLKNEYAFRGFDKLPFAILNTTTAVSIFLNKRKFGLLALCDGITDLSVVSKETKEYLQIAFENGYIEECEYGSILNSYQLYRKSPARYMRGVHWSITGKCNLTCKHCYVNAPGTTNELSFDECKYIIKQLVKANIAEVSITGGEPLVRNDFWQLVDLMHENKLLVSQVHTNGILVDETFLDECEKRGFQKWLFCMSFDGVGCHDWMRGQDGAESVLIEAVRLIKSRGHIVILTTALHKGNLASLPETYELVKKLGVDKWKMSRVINTGEWANGEYTDTKQEIPIDELFENYLELIKLYRKDNMPFELLLCGFFRNEKGRKEFTLTPVCAEMDANALNVTTCLSCRNYMYLTGGGKVIPCMPMCGTDAEKLAPNILTTPIEELLSENSSYFKMINTRIKEVHSKNETCNTCEFKLMCSRCPANAMQETGDFYGIDSNSCYFFNNNYIEKITSVINATEATVNKKD